MAFASSLPLAATRAADLALHLEVSRHTGDERRIITPGRAWMVHSCLSALSLGLLNFRNRAGTTGSFDA
jgi:hypothetical protein